MKGEVVGVLGKHAFTIDTKGLVIYIVDFENNTNILHTGSFSFTIYVLHPALIVLKTKIKYFIGKLWSLKNILMREAKSTLLLDYLVQTTGLIINYN